MQAGVRKALETGTGHRLPQGSSRRYVESPRGEEGALGSSFEKLVIDKDMLQEFLGGVQVRVDMEVFERTRRAGVAVGLAWTPAGGDVLFIEANRMKGKGGFTVTRPDWRSDAGVDAELR